MTDSALDLFLRRRSIRSYTEQPVARELIEAILQAAMAAPSACNNQPWEFVVITAAETMDEIRANLPMARYNAPCAILVCGNMDLCRNTKAMWVQDCSAALENILLAATALGLGSVWVGVYGVAPFVEKVARIVGLPENVMPLGFAYLGYPAEQREPRTQYDARRIYWDAYDQTRKHRARPKNLKYR
jgi:nitroreductase